MDWLVWSVLLHGLLKGIQEACTLVLRLTSISKSPLTAAQFNARNDTVFVAQMLSQKAGKNLKT